MSTPATKTCSKCREVKPVEQFNKRNAAKDGLQSRCRECVRENDRAWRQANPERKREKNRAWREANRERVRENDRARYQANPERKREIDRAWRKANPDKKKMADHRRRARKACAVPQRWIVDHSLGDPLACWWCGRGLLGAKVTIEHVMPIELKGPTVPSNLVSACSTCNSRKQETHPLVWIAELVDG